MSPPGGGAPSDAGIRERLRSELGTSFAVGAGAGTGKTSVLVERVLTLIDAGTPIQEIVAITFTERAAGELRDRLRAALGSPAADADESVRGHRERARDQIELAQFTTIHGFCRHLLSSRPLEAGVGPGFRVMDALQSGLLLDEVTEERLRELRASDGTELERALIAGARLPAFGDLVKALRRFPDLEPSAPAPAAPSLEEAAAQILAIAARVTGSAEGVPDEDRLLAQARGVVTSLEDLEAEDPDEIQRFTVLSGLTMHRNVGNRGNWKNARVDLGGLKEAWKRVAGIRQEAITGWGEARLAWLKEEGARVLDRYEERKRALGAVDFDDLLLLTDRLLESEPEILEDLKRSHRVLLVDESQDTDPVQARIVLRLSTGPGEGEGAWQASRPAPGRLFLVGDRNQSIYRFRRADLETYAQARGQVAAAGAEEFLLVNFRSLPALVETANKVFGGVLPAQDYGELEAYRTAGPGAPEGPPVTLLAVDPLLEDPQDVKIAQMRAAESRALAAWLQTARSAGRPVWDRGSGAWRPMRWSDVAILIRSTSGADVIEEELEQAGIPYRMAGGRSFFARLEVLQTLSVLRAIADPSNEITMVAALRSPYFGVSEEELVRWAATGRPFSLLAGLEAEDLPESARNACRVLAELRQESVRTTPSGLLRSLYASTRCLPLHALKPDGDRRIANLLKLLDLAGAYERAAQAVGEGPAGPSGMVAYLEEQRTAASEEESRLVDEEGDAVTLMTVHAAKGLEFPVVALLDRDARPTFKDDAIPLRGSGRVALRGAGLAPAGWEEIREAERAEQYAENRRLLYVAFTRARDHLLMAAPRGTPPALMSETGQETEPFLAPLEAALRRLAEERPDLVDWTEGRLPTRRPSAPHRLPRDLAVPGEREVEDAVLKRRRERDEHRTAMGRPAPGRLLRASELPKRQVGHPHSRQEQAPDRGAARRLGTRAHEALERRVQAGVESAEAIRQVVRPWDPEDLEGSLAPLVENGVRLLEAACEEGWRVAAAEWPLMGDLDLLDDLPAAPAPHGGDEDAPIGFTGSADLILEREGEGRLLVVDYKSDPMPASALAERYALQLRAYAVALEGATGRPVSCEIWSLHSGERESL